MDTEPDVITARLARTDTTVTVTLSAYAIERYLQRVRPTAGRETAVAQIARLFGIGAIGPRPAAWDLTLRPAPLYLTVGDVSFVLDVDRSAREQLIVRTCLARGTCWSPGRRRHPVRAAPA